MPYLTPEDIEIYQVVEKPAEIVPAIEAYLKRGEG